MIEIFNDPYIVGVSQTPRSDVTSQSMNQTSIDNPAHNITMYKSPVPSYYIHNMTSFIVNSMNRIEQLEIYQKFS